MCQSLIRGSFRGHGPTNPAHKNDKLAQGEAGQLTARVNGAGRSSDLCSRVRHELGSAAALFGHPLSHPFTRNPHQVTETGCPDRTSAGFLCDRTSQNYGTWRIRKHTRWGNCGPKGDQGRSRDHAPQLVFLDYCTWCWKIKPSTRDG